MNSTHGDGRIPSLRHLKQFVHLLSFRPNWRLHPFLVLTTVIIILSMLIGCGPSTRELETVDYAPLPGSGWEVSAPEEQGLDPMVVAELYLNAAETETLYGLLIIQNRQLIAEKYFNEGSVDQLSARHSATKSFLSALVGIALDQGCLSDRC